MQHRQGSKFISKIDISMDFYIFKIYTNSQNRCVISTPFGLFKYLRLPMGITNSPDFFQSVMHPLFADLSNVEYFIDNIGIFSIDSFSDHLQKLHQVLLRLERHGFIVNPLKCEWAAQSTEYLGFLLTPQGIKPLPHTVQAITSIARSSSTKQVHFFVGLVNYYKDMWPKRANHLTPLTEICSARRKFVWSDSQENAFQTIKRLVSEDVMLRFTDHSKPFEIYTDASNFQLGAAIKQNNLQIAYFSKKMTPTQRRYSTIEQEILAIVQVLKEYKNFLLGAQITIYTNHKNLLANSSTNNRVFRWKQKIEEYTPTLHYVKGHTNIEADALSRLPSMNPNQAIEVMLNHPPVDPVDPSNPILDSYPLDLKLINKYQQSDQPLMKAVQEDKRFSFTNLYGNKLIIDHPLRAQRHCIVVPQQLQFPVVRWIHSILGHAGISRLNETLSSHFWFPQMRSMIRCTRIYD